MLGGDCHFDSALTINRLSSSRLFLSLFSLEGVRWCDTALACTVLLDTRPGGSPPWRCGISCLPAGLIPASYDGWEGRWTLQTCRRFLPAYCRLTDTCRWDRHFSAKHCIFSAPHHHLPSPFLHILFHHIPPPLVFSSSRLQAPPGGLCSCSLDNRWSRRTCSLPYSPLLHKLCDFCGPGLSGTSTGYMRAI